MTKHFATDSVGLKAVHVVPSIDEEASGPSYSVVRLCESLIHAGTDLNLAALDWAPMHSPPDMLRRFKVGWGPRRLGRSPEMLRWLKMIVHEETIDIIHSHVLWQMNSIYPSRVIGNSSAKLVVSPRGSLSPWAMQSGSKLKKGFWPLLQKPALHDAHCLHATADQEYEDIRQLGFKQPICILPNGVDLPVFESETIKKRNEVLYVGRLHAKKGLENLLQAWSALENKFDSWRLVIAGPDESYEKGDQYARHLKNMSVKMGLARVSFPGALYGDDKFRAYREASLFVLPTHSENFGITVAEALASATPAIVTRGAPWSGLDTYNAGWWIDIGVDPLIAGLSEAMSLASAERDEMGVAGRDWMRRDFSWDEIGTKMLQTYRWLVGKDDKPDYVILD